MPSISTENYLKALYNSEHSVSEPSNRISIANQLSVSNAAISDMAKKLSNKGLISYEKYKGMELTSEGKRIALKVIRRHRLWELFLIKVLDLPWSEVHKEAEKLEHHTSEFLIDKIDEYLGFPEFDPHGHPIPNKNGSVPKVPDSILLSETNTEKFYEFVQVDDKDEKLIEYLTKVGFLLHTVFEVKDKLEFDGSSTVYFDNKSLSLSKKISESIFVKNINKI